VTVWPPLFILGDVMGLGYVIRSAILSPAAGFLLPPPMLLILGGYLTCTL
jgi:hypothetical protein